MSLKYLNLKLGIFALGLVVIIVLAAVLSAGEQARAATPTADCVGPLSKQEKASCEAAAQATGSGFGTMVAWFFPGTENHLLKSEAIPAKNAEKGAGSAEQESSGILPRDALLLFGVALLGIIYLGRRRRKIRIDRK